MPQESKRQISVQLVDAKDYKDGFNIRIEDGFIKYQYGLPNAKDGKICCLGFGLTTVISKI